MNNKEFIAELARRMEYSAKDTSSIMAGLLTEVGERLEEESVITIQGFGVFEVKKKLERVLVNPSTKQRMLIPPKMVLGFKASSILKDKFKGLGTDGK